MLVITDTKDENIRNKKTIREGCVRRGRGAEEGDEEEERGKKVSGIKRRTRGRKQERNRRNKTKGEIVKVKENES